MTRVISTLSLVALLSACGDGAKEGEECTSDADCAEGLECHMHDGEEDHGECEAADDHEDGDDHEDEDTAAAE